MISQWLNHPYGLAYYDAGGKPPSLWDWYPAKLWWAVLCDPPLIYINPDTLEWQTLVNPNLLTDGGTTMWAQLIPGFSPVRFITDFTLHDDGYAEGKINGSMDEGKTWNIRDATKDEVDARLKDGILHDPGDPGLYIEAEPIYLAVQEFGGQFWKGGGLKAMMQRAMIARGAAPTILRL